jgi:hypothetical protein
MIYVYSCSCGTRTEAHRKVKDRRRSPKHCGKSMKLEISGGQLIIKPFESYIAVGAPDKRVIRTRTEHRDMLRELGKVEIGNDSSMAPPVIHPDEQRARDHDMQRSLQELRQTSSETAAFVSE